LPDIKAGADFKFDITDQWFAGVDLYYVGKRKDWFENADLMESKIVDVKSYADFNLKVGYRPTKNWTVFIKGNNLLNDQYSQWSNFDVQGIQILGGAMYKFDF
jgi:outer membrane receptor protein involved in Fe transport